jgi:hypothetical protein
VTDAEEKNELLARVSHASCCHGVYFWYCCYLLVETMTYLLCVFKLQLVFMVLFMEHTGAAMLMAFAAGYYLGRKK